MLWTNYSVRIERFFKEKKIFFLLRKYSTAANRLQQRTIDVFYRILNTNENEYTWPTQYGAFIGLCEMSHKVNLLFIYKCFFDD